MTTPPSSKQNRREPDDARRLAVGESVIKCLYASETCSITAMIVIISLGTFSGDGHLMTDSPQATPIAKKPIASGGCDAPSAPKANQIDEIDSCSSCRSERNVSL